VIKLVISFGVMRCRFFLGFFPHFIFYFLDYVGFFWFFYFLYCDFIRHIYSFNFILFSFFESYYLSVDSFGFGMVFWFAQVSVLSVYDRLFTRFECLVWFGLWVRSCFLSVFIILFFRFLSVFWSGLV
jgi:hypothetical protein